MLSSASPVGLVGGNSSNMQQASSSVAFAGYGDRTQMGLDVEFGADPASGAFFQSDGRKHEDLKQMLDSNKDGLKLEAMKRIIGMIARGRDSSDLFPAVVKNVVSKNIEVKKLVYVYLVRYAEEQQDLALLSISTFQRALKDPNQLIRASALRVLSSIRVSMIVPIVMLAIRDSAADMSPYVRKTAAHAIPKLYSLDETQKDELVMVIDKLLSDRTTLVVGSAVMAFDEVCPERVDLIHKNYRKLCNLLVDVDEWGQVIIINMLTRYARTQFLDPNADEFDENALGEGETKQQKFYDDDDSSSDNDAASNKNKPSKKRRSSSTTTYVVDLDHRLLLRQTKPLLQSRNASVVMAVAQLYHHIAPRHEVQIIAKALVRLLRSHKEVQSVVLTCIASMSTKRKAMFESYIKSFFVRTSDPTHIKLLKLDILTNLATASSISLILREFQTYISSSDRYFVAATIQAIGRCAASIKEVTETCLNGLVQLLSNRDEHIVAESVVVLKKLLQTKAAEHYEIIARMAKLLDFITVPAARSSIIWLIGEYNEKVTKIAPDVLRKMAKTFVDEEDVVKLQVLNLGVKLYLNNAEQTSLLVQYVFTLARYDANYDIRDRARLLKQFILPAATADGKSNILSDKARQIFLSSKPAPAVESKWCDRNNYQLGSLSHYLSMPATGYTDLPEFPAVAPDASVRNIEGFMTESTGLVTGDNGTLNEQTIEKLNKKKDKDFYATSDKSSTYTDSETSASSDSSDDESASCAKEVKTIEKHSKLQGCKKVQVDLIDTGNNNGTSDSDGESTTGEESSSSSGSNSESYDSASQSGKELERELEVQEKEEEKKIKVHKQEEKSNMDLLLDLDDITPMGPVMTPSLGGFLTPGFVNSPSTIFTQNDEKRIDLVSPSYVEVKHKELLNKLSGHGLHVGYRFTRAPHLYSASMVSIELQFINQSQEEIINIQVGQKSLPAGMQMNDFAPVMRLLPQQLATSNLGVDFNDSTHAIDFELISSAGKSRINFKPPVGELIRSVLISETYFREECSKLRGMNEHQTKLQLKMLNNNMAKLQQKIMECTNVARLPLANRSSSSSSSENNLLHFVGQTMTSKSLVLISLDCNSMENPTLTVNCEKMVIGSMILNELRNALTLAFK